MKGLAYVDFSDDEHLAAAVAKNKQKLIGKKLSIARSEPKRGGRESSNPKTLTEHGMYSEFWMFLLTQVHAWICCAPAILPG